MKLIIFIQIVLLVAAAEAVTQTVLEKIAKEEKGWNRVMVSSSSAIPFSIAAYLTAKGTARLDKIPTAIQVPAQLSSPLLDRFKPKKNLESICSSDYLAVFLGEKESSFKISGVANAMTGKVLKQGLLYQQQVVRLQNPPLYFGVDAKLTFTTDSRTLMRRHVREKEIIKEIEKQLYAQNSKIELNGNFELNLPGWHDLSCDLIFGQATLTVTAGYGYEAPILDRNVTLSMEQLKSSLGDLTLLDSKYKSFTGRLNLVRAGLMIAESSAHWSIDPKMQERMFSEKLERLFKIYFDGQGDLRRSIDFSEAQKQLQEYEYGYYHQFTNHVQNMEWKVGP